MAEKRLPVTGRKMRKQGSPFRKAGAAVVKVNREALESLKKK